MVGTATARATAPQVVFINVDMVERDVPFFFLGEEVLRGVWNTNSLEDERGNVIDIIVYSCS